MVLSMGEESMSHYKKSIQDEKFCHNHLGKYNLLVCQLMVNNITAFAMRIKCKILGIL